MQIHRVLSLALTSIALLLSISTARADSKLLPPTEDLQGATVCQAYPSKVGRVLSWNGQDAMTCSNTLVIDTSGNIGIGTTSPQTTLDVNGETKIASTGAACSSAYEGALRYNKQTKNVEVCKPDSSTTYAWKAIGTWQTVPLNDGNDYDISCEYQVKYSDPYVSADSYQNTGSFHPPIVYPKFLGMTNNGDSMLVGIPSGNKRAMYYLQGPSSGSAIPGIVTLEMKKRCAN